MKVSSLTKYRDWFRFPFLTSCPSRDATCATCARTLLLTGNRFGVNGNALLEFKKKCKTPSHADFLKPRVKRLAHCLVYRHGGPGNDLTMCHLRRQAEAEKRKRKTISKPSSTVVVFQFRIMCKARVHTHARTRARTHTHTHTHTHTRARARAQGFLHHMLQT